MQISVGFSDDYQFSDVIEMVARLGFREPLYDPDKHEPLITMEEAPIKMISHHKDLIIEDYEEESDISLDNTR